MNLRVKRAGHKAFFGELAQARGVRWAEVHGFVGVIELTHDGREQQDAPYKRRQLGLSVQKQIATKGVGDDLRIAAPKVVVQISGYLRDLFVKGQGSKVADGLSARDVEAALQQCAAQARVQAAAVAG